MCVLSCQIPEHVEDVTHRPALSRVPPVPAAEYDCLLVCNQPIVQCCTWSNRNFKTPDMRDDRHRSRLRRSSTIDGSRSEEYACN
jgi:hypothetical protein